MLVAVRSYNSYGSSEKRGNLDEKKLIVVRMQLKNIRSEVQAGMDIGSVIYAQSFFIVEPQTSICLTKGVPNSLVWLTDNMHYRNTPLPLDIEKPLDCEKLGQMQDSTKDDITGFYPVKEEHQQTLTDRILSGKLTFFDHGIVFTDMRLGAFILPYYAISRITIHGNTNSSNDWVQI